MKKRREKNNNFSKNTLNLIEKSKKINISLVIFFITRDINAIFVCLYTHIYCPKLYIYYNSNS